MPDSLLKNVIQYQVVLYLEIFFCTPQSRSAKVSIVPFPPTTPSRSLRRIDLLTSLVMTKAHYTFAGDEKKRNAAKGVRKVLEGLFFALTFCSARRLC